MLPQYLRYDVPGGFPSVQSLSKLRPHVRDFSTSWVQVFLYGLPLRWRSHGSGVSPAHAQDTPCSIFCLRQLALGVNRTSH